MTFAEDFAESGWIDVTVPIYDRMIRWPTDPEVRVFSFRDQKKGDRYTASELHLGSHTGTHLDSPRHFFEDGIPVSEWLPEITVGPARVLVVPPEEKAIEVSFLKSQSIAPRERIILKTGNSQFWKNHDETFHSDFVALTPEAAKFLAECRCICVGVDYLSVGPDNDHKNSEVHRALLGAGVWVIEALDLSTVVPGNYDLLCLPLNLKDRDAAPVRALLRPLVKG